MPGARSLIAFWKRVSLDTIFEMREARYEIHPKNRKERRSAQTKMLICVYLRDLRFLLLDADP